jgi:xylitol oxidase
VYQNLDLEHAQENFQEISSRAYSVSLFTDWLGPNINQVWVKSGGEEEFEDYFFGAKLSTRNLHPIGEISAVNCTEQLGIPGPWHERLPHFRMNFTPSAGEELQSEYLMPRQHASDALRAILSIRDLVAPHLLVSEIRTIAADELWMSPSYKQDSVGIHFTWKQDWPRVKEVLPVIEDHLAPFGARPHWGKLFTTDPSRLQSLYPKLPEFRELRDAYDPDGKFRNAFLDRNLG